MGNLKSECALILGRDIRGKDVVVLWISSQVRVVEQNAGIKMEGSVIFSFLN